MDRRHLDLLHKPSRFYERQEVDGGTTKRRILRYHKFFGYSVRERVETIKDLHIRGNLNDERYLYRVMESFAMETDSELFETFFRGDLRICNYIRNFGGKAEEISKSKGTLVEEESKLYEMIHTAERVWQREIKESITLPEEYKHSDRSLWFLKGDEFNTLDANLRRILDALRTLSLSPVFHVKDSSRDETLDGLLCEIFFSISLEERTAVIFPFILRQSGCLNILSSISSWMKRENKVSTINMKEFINELLIQKYNDMKEPVSWILAASFRHLAKRFQKYFLEIFFYAVIEVLQPLNQHHIHHLTNFLNEDFEREDVVYVIAKVLDFSPILNVRGLQILALISYSAEEAICYFEQKLLDRISHALLEVVLRDDEMEKLSNILGK